MKDAHPKFVVRSSFDCTNRPLIVPLLPLTSIGLDRNWLCMGAHEPVPIKQPDVDGRLQQAAVSLSQEASSGKEGEKYIHGWGRISSW